MTQKTITVRATSNPVFLPGIPRRLDERGREASAVYPDEPRTVECSRFIRMRLRAGDLVEVVPASAPVSVVPVASATEKG